jgi:glycine/D-amino acid oxidase-like deaminating enzyme
LPDFAEKLHERLIRILPDLARTRLSHVWTGACAATFDLYPHIGMHDGMHFALGYCFGSGLPLGTWLGHRVAQRILGHGDAATALDDLALTSRPYYWGRPWFVPLMVRYYGWVDRRGF